MRAKVKPIRKRLPDGTWVYVWPFHISLEGLKRNIICRDDADCDMLVKAIALCALRCNVIVIIYAVVSNHAHIAILAKTYEEAYRYAQEVKRLYSMHFRFRYGEAKVLKDTDVCVQALDNYDYLRNALAYIPRNALDNGASCIADYKWTGFRAFFRKTKPFDRFKQVSQMSVRERKRVFHTEEDLSATCWVVNDKDELEPQSFCDTEYLEWAFHKDEAFFLRLVGGVNVSEMTEKLVMSPRQKRTDADFFKEVNDISVTWFSAPVRDLSKTQKARLLPYVYRMMRTTVMQMARTFGLDREEISRLLNSPISEVS